MTELLTWWNLLFLLPLVAGLLLILLQMSGVASEHEADHDSDGEGGGHMGESDDDSLLARAASLLGVGRVPTSIVVTTFLLLWGFCGWATLQIVAPALGGPLAVAPATAVALAGSLAGTRLFTRLVSKALPPSESYATGRRELIGHEGEALFAINETFGRARVRDDYGNLQEVSCRIESGATAVNPGDRVWLRRYDEAQDAYVVTNEDPLS